MRIKGEIAPNMLWTAFINVLLKLKVCGSHSIKDTYVDKYGVNRARTIQINSDSYSAQYIRIILKRKYGYVFKPKQNPPRSTREVLGCGDGTAEIITPSEN
jgi:hypothetical protein